MSAKHSNAPGACPKCSDFLTEVDPQLASWFSLERAKDHTLHVSCGYRGKAEQAAALARGASKAVYGKSPHNYRPSMAIDVFFINGDKACYPKEGYQRLAKTLPEDLQSGGTFSIGFIDWPHVQVRDFKVRVKNWPNGDE